ncbi:MAG: cell division protein FtsZ [Patescibacteria group bacterium]|jgi:cell division protein FtsZ
MPQVKPEMEAFAKIKVVGVGGSGGSAINRMMATKIRGVDFIAMNTDVQALHYNSAPHKIHIGKSVTRGLGAGMDPEIGRRAAEESQNEIREALKDTDMVFITCGMGGGTGSGASSLVAQIAKEMGALTIAVVTKPFSWEGPQRCAIAEKAWEELAKNVDSIITIPNDRILQVVEKKTGLLEAFKIADDVLRQGVQGISELITIPGLINVDFADVKAIMRDTGSALMGIGSSTGENRAIEAARGAISSPLLELSIDGAHGILFTITGGPDLAMSEVSEAAKIITSSAAPDAKIIFGAIIDESMTGSMRISVVATGFDGRRPSSNREEESNAGFLGGKYVPSNFLRKTQKEEEEKEKMFKTIVQKSPVTPVATPDKNKTPVQTPEEELEIPTFIRRKMGL